MMLSLGPNLDEVYKDVTVVNCGALITCGHTLPPFEQKQIVVGKREKEKE